MCEIFVQYISHGSLDSFENRAFDIGVPTDLKLYALSFQQLLKWRVKEFFPLVGSNPDGASLERFQISGFFTTDLKAALTSLPDYILGKPCVRILKRRRLPLTDI